MVSLLLLNVTAPKCLCCQCCTGGAASPKTICYCLSCKVPVPCLSSGKESGWARDWSKADLHWKLTAVCQQQWPQWSSVKGTDEPGASAASPVTSLSRGAEAAPQVLLALRCLWVSCYAVSCQTFNLCVPHVMLRGLVEGHSRYLYVHLFWNLKICRFKLSFLMEENGFFYMNICRKDSSSVSFKFAILSELGYLLPY